MGKVHRAVAERRGKVKHIAGEGVKTEEVGRLLLVVALNCLPDCALEEGALKGVASVEHVSLEHVSLAQVGEGKIEAAAAVLLHSLAYLPRAAQRRLQPWQLVLTLSCMDKMVDSALANYLGLQLLHVDSGRAEEVADTVMALLLGLLRHTHVLASYGYASAGWECFAPNRDPSECFAVVSAIATVSSFSGRKFSLSLPTLPSEVQASLVVLSGPKPCRVARLRCSCVVVYFVRSSVSPSAGWPQGILQVIGVQRVPVGWKEEIGWLLSLHCG
jgi:hypothetical protein